MENRREVPRRVQRALVVSMAMVVASCGLWGDDEDPDPTTGSSAPERGSDDLRLNELQTIGTHNSFHVAPPPGEFALLEALNPVQAAQRAYSHQPIATQLSEQKVRELEFDVFADSEGGLFLDPVLRRQAGLPPLVDEVPEMALPGTKVLHEQDVDYHTVCPTLVSCLAELKAWSDEHPDHVPVAVHIQFKDGPLIFPVPEQAVPERWTPDAMTRLDEEITTVFPLERIITPADVRGDAPTLEAAVLDGGWPTLGESRGKVMFLMINAEPYRTFYLDAHPKLEGAILFTNASPGTPDAAYVGVDDPVAHKERITGLVEDGYLVRVRADMAHIQGRTGDTTRRDAAFASGAHWVSTDYPGPDGAKPQTGVDYKVELPDYVAVRCNPVTAPEGCEAEDIEAA